MHDPLPPGLVEMAQIPPTSLKYRPMLVENNQGMTIDVTFEYSILIYIKHTICF